MPALAGRKERTRDRTAGLVGANTKRARGSATNRGPVMVAGVGNFATAFDMGAARPPRRATAHGTKREPAAGEGGSLQMPMRRGSSTHREKVVVGDEQWLGVAFLQFFVSERPVT